ncbi:MAG: hypothetical protein R2873_11325 [Caldilineaceae bacterium]
MTQATVDSVLVKPRTISSSSRRPGGAKLTITKSADVTSTVPGGVIEYTIVVSNTGTGSATGVSVQDPIPQGQPHLRHAQATAPTADDSNPAIMRWTGNIPRRRRGDTSSSRSKSHRICNAPVNWSTPPSCSTPRAHRSANTSYSR